MLRMRKRINSRNYLKMRTHEHGKKNSIKVGTLLTLKRNT